MKGYYGQKELRLSGKAWEVRAKLRQLERKSSRSTTLAEWLQGPQHATAASLKFTMPLAEDSALLPLRSCSMTEDPFQ